MRRREFLRLTYALIVVAVFGVAVHAPDVFFTTLTALAGATAAQAARRGKDEDEK